MYTRGPTRASVLYVCASLCVSKWFDSKAENSKDRHRHVESRRLSLPPLLRRVPAPAAPPTEAVQNPATTASYPLPQPPCLPEQPARTAGYLSSPMQTQSNRPFFPVPLHRRVHSARAPNTRPACRHQTLLLLRVWHHQPPVAWHGAHRRTSCRWHPCRNLL